MKDKQFLMIPGPTPVPERALLAMAKHPLGHRSSEFSAIMKEKINNSLNASGLFAEAGAVNVMSVVVDVDYQRRFAGEDTPIPSESVMAPVVGYTIVVKENGVEKNRVSKSNLVITKGFFGNLISVFTLGLGKDSKDEVVDIESFADHVVKQLRDM